MHTSVQCNGGHNCAAPSRVMPRRTNAAIVEMAHPESPHGSERFTKELRMYSNAKAHFAQAKGVFGSGLERFFFLNNSGDNRCAPEWELHYCG
jgi:hypothetical protein